MVMDFLIELFSDFSPMYVYFSVLLSVFCAFQWMPIVTHNLYQDTQIDIRIHHKRIELAPIQNRTNEMIKRRNWLAVVTKRIELPDEDEDADGSFYHNKSCTLQGGTSCKNLYSLSLKKQVS